MRTLRHVAWTSSLLLLAVSTARAQSPGVQPAGTAIAVLDVGKVFETYKPFKDKLEAIKQEVKAFESEINNERKTITDRAAELQQYRAGSFEYKRLETELAKKTSDIQVQAQLKRKDILEREARVYYETYQQMVAAVGRIAKQHGLALVLRYNSKPIDAANRADVLRGVNQTVVFQDHRDITSLVLEEIGKTPIARPPFPRVR